MVDILHRVGIVTARDQVFRALTVPEDLARWWTVDTHGDGEPGGVLAFRFEGAPAPGGFDMKVLDAQPGDRVLWEVIDGPEEWVGTEVSWDLRTEGGHTIVVFAHRGWREPVEFMHHCSTKWATYLMSLKAFLETGTGAPSPHDVRISEYD